MNSGTNTDKSDDSLDLVGVWMGVSFVSGMLLMVIMLFVAPKLYSNRRAKVVQHPPVVLSSVERTFVTTIPKMDRALILESSHKTSSQSESKEAPYKECSLYYC